MVEELVEKRRCSLPFYSCKFMNDLVFYLTITKLVPDRQVFLSVTNEITRNNICSFFGQGPLISKC